MGSSELSRWHTGKVGNDKKKAREENRGSLSRLLFCWFGAFFVQKECEIRSLFFWFVSVCFLFRISSANTEAKATKREREKKDSSLTSLVSCLRRGVSLRHFLSSFGVFSVVRLVRRRKFWVRGGVFPRQESVTIEKRSHLNQLSLSLFPLSFFFFLLGFFFLFSLVTFFLKRAAEDGRDGAREANSEESVLVFYFS